MSDASYLTREGMERLQAELADMKGPQREEIAKRLRIAIEQGDLSENADWTAAKEAQGFLEGRIKEIEYVLSNVILIEDVAKNKGEIGIGDTVTIQEAGEEPEVYQLVGPKEADPLKGRISHESPIGKALIGKKKGTSVTVDTPGGSLKFKVLKIE